MMQQRRASGAGRPRDAGRWFRGVTASKKEKTMKTPLSHNCFLLLSGSIASGIGAAILTVPGVFYAIYGIALGTHPSLLNEIRAPGGALLALGLLILAGAFVPAMRMNSTLIATLVYLSYGLSRVLGMVVDGWPDGGLIAAAALELVIGSIGATVLLRNWHALPARLKHP